MRKMLLVSDMDKTLLTDDACVSAENLEAVRRFTEAGNYFTVATGRPTRGVRIFPELLEYINLPVISFNGCVLYDFRKEEPVRRFLLDSEELKAVLIKVKREFPDVGAVVSFGENDEAFVDGENEYTVEVSQKRERFTPKKRAMSDAPLPWTKVVFAGEKGRMKQCFDLLQAEAAGMKHNPAHIVLTEGIFIEVFSEEADKGRALDILSSMYGISPDSVIAIGDSVNDLSLITHAGYRAAVSNAEKAVLDAADIIVASNGENGVAELIGRIMDPVPGDRFI